LAFSEFQLFDLKGAKNVHLLNWALVDANVSNEYKVANYASQARKIIDNHLWSNEPTIYLIERQSLRPIGISCTTN
jgi:hemolysin-activating ACP:hemolysin acyltransferase